MRGSDTTVGAGRPGAVPREIRYLDDSAGVPAGTIWGDISPINSQAKERLGYPTQKPEALLERIIATSSQQEDLVLDPFCGCGTAIVVAQKLNRRWVGIDLTHLAIAVMKKRLADSFAIAPGVDYAVVGEPTDMTGARALAEQDRYQFQWWALSLVWCRSLMPSLQVPPITPLSLRSEWTRGLTG